MLAQACGGAEVSFTEAGGDAQAIVSGQPANSAQLFGTVYVEIGGGNCTGTLIAPTVVVTAAHCVALQPGYLVPPQQIRVGAGALDAAYAQASQIYGVSAVTAHPQYTYLAAGFTNDPTGLGNMNDIAVLVLSTPVQGMQPVPLLSMNNLDAQIVPGSTQLIISGYGLLQAGGYDNTMLYIAATPYQRRTETEVLLGGLGAPDTCQGDSGGPAYLLVGSQPYLVGATSRGIFDPDIECGAGGVSTLVPAFANWIASVSYGGYTAPDGGGGSVPEPAACANECTQNMLAPCSCAASDPCGWRNDGMCDDRCAQFNATPFDDSEDCEGSTSNPPPPPGQNTACNGACLTASYNACTCGSADPCGWSGDGFCDASCAQYETHFDDSQDCSTPPDSSNPPDNTDPPDHTDPPSTPGTTPPSGGGSTTAPDNNGNPPSNSSPNVLQPGNSTPAADTRQVSNNSLACRCLSTPDAPPFLALLAILPWLATRRRKLLNT